VPPDQGQAAFLQVSINQTDIGDVMVILRRRDTLVRVADLEKGGVLATNGVREMRDAELFVSLRSLAPKVTYIFNEAGLSMAIRADPSLFPASVVDLRPKRPEGILYSTAPSMFVNYSLGLYELQSRDAFGWNGLSEAGLSIGGQLLYGSVEHLPDGTWVRLMNNLTLDWRDKLTRIIVGDSTATSDALGGVLSMGGLGVTRTFALDPYFIMLPFRQLSGTALTPSTVEVYVNGQLVRREALPPGQFNLANVPLTTGSGETRVVVRDAFGNEQSMVSPYYLALGTLAKGLSDFSYNLGFQRWSYGSKSWSYGAPAMLLRHRIGITDYLTVGGRAEGTQHTISGGPSAALRLPVGELAAIVAVSGTNEPWRVSDVAGSLGTAPILCTKTSSPGFAALLSYSYVKPKFNLQLGGQVQSNCYVNLSLPMATDRQHFDVTASTALVLNKVGIVSLQFSVAEWRDQGWRDRILLLGNRAINRWLYAFVTLGGTFQPGTSAVYETFAGLSFNLGDRTSASASRTDNWGGSGHHGTDHVDVQRSLPMGPGYGYRVVAEAGTNAIEEANAQYQGAHGRIEADYRRDGLAATDQSHATLTGSGGVVLIDRDIFLTRPVQDSYALIQVPGVAGVHGTISNQVVGTTDSKGNLLLPSLLQYYGNRVGIHDKDIPLDYNIGATEMTIAPPYRGGAVVRFPIRRVQSVSGTVLVEECGASTVPRYGQITVQVESKPVDSPLDEAGNFYLENVPAGSYSAEIQYATGECRFQLVVTAGAAALVNAGTIHCVVPRKESP
jgi:outer membrane usher protein